MSATATPLDAWVDYFAGPDGGAPDKFSGVLRTDPSDFAGLAFETAAHIGGGSNTLFFCRLCLSDEKLFPRGMADGFDRARAQTAFELVERGNPIDESTPTTRVFTNIKRFVAMAGAMSRIGLDPDTDRYCAALAQAMAALGGSPAFEPMRVLFASVRKRVDAVRAAAGAGTAGPEDAENPPWAFNPGKYFVFVERYLEQLALAQANADVGVNDE